MAHRFLERETEHVLDHDLMREPDAEHEVSAARGLHGERLLRHRHRVPAVGGHDAGGELDAGDFVADDRQRAHRVEREDLGQRVRRETVGLCGPGVGDEVVDGEMAGVAPEDPDPHG